MEPSHKKFLDGRSFYLFFFTLVILRKFCDDHMFHHRNFADIFPTILSSKAQQKNKVVASILEIAIFKHKTLLI